MPPRPASLKVRALQWLAQREYSRSELRERLLRLEPEPETVDALLDWLLQHGWLSDARFIESRVNARAPRYGQARIEAELRRHGVEPDAATRETLRDTELQRAREVWTRRYGTPAADAAARLRQMRFLAGRGFSSDVVRQVVPRAAPVDAGSDADEPAPATRGDNPRRPWRTPR